MGWAFCCRRSPKPRCVHVCCLLFQVSHSLSSTRGYLWRAGSDEEVKIKISERVRHPVCEPVSEHGHMRGSVSRAYMEPLLWSRWQLCCRWCVWLPNVWTIYAITLCLSGWVGAFIRATVRNTVIPLRIGAYLDWCDPRNKVATSF